jgi:hypothetical protein
MTLISFYCKRNKAIKLLDFFISPYNVWELSALGAPTPFGSPASIICLVSNKKCACTMAG